MSNSNFLHIDSMSLQGIDEDADLIPLMTPEDEAEINNEILPESLPILPLRNTVLFPGVVIPITAGRDRSIKLLNEVNKKQGLLGVVSQKDGSEEDPNPEDLYRTGTVARIIRSFKLPNGHTAVILQGLRRFVIEE